MGMSEDGCSRQTPGSWAMMADNIGSVFQIGEEIPKQPISEYCACHGMPVIQITVSKPNPPGRLCRYHQDLKGRCPWEILIGEAFMRELTEDLLITC